MLPVASILIVQLLTRWHRLSLKMMSNGALFECALSQHAEVTDDNPIALHHSKHKHARNEGRKVNVKAGLE